MFVWICVAVPKRRIWPGDARPSTKWHQKRLHNTQIGGNKMTKWGEKASFHGHFLTSFRSFGSFPHRGSVAEKLSICQWLRFIPHEEAVKR